MEDQQYVMEQFFEVNSLYKSRNYLKAMLLMDSLQQFYSKYFKDESKFLDKFFLENKALFSGDGDKYIADMPVVVDKILCNQAPGLRK